MNQSGDQLKIMVRYYAVYPGGRRCLVTRQQVEEHADDWAAQDNVSIVTVIEEELVPVYGTLELLNS